MGSYVGRRAVLAMAVVAACLLGAAPALADPPSNDSKATPHVLNIARELTGARGAAIDQALPSPSQLTSVDISEATSSPADDPILRNDSEDSTCNSAPIQGDHTVFYRLAGKGPNLLERTAMTIDTLGSTYATVLAVFEGSIDASTMIACGRGNLSDGASSVDFISEVGKDYYLEVAAVSAAGKLNLYIQADDIQPPTFAVTAAEVLPVPGGRTTFQISDPVDEGSGLATRSYEWSVEFVPDIGPVTKPNITVKDEGRAIEVLWPSGEKVVGRGIASVRVWDIAGNVGWNRLSLRVKDRKPPRVLQSRIETNFGSRLVRATIRCTEAGRGVIKLIGRSGFKTASLKLNRAREQKTASFYRRPRGAYIATFQCIDSRGNKSAAAPRAFAFGL